ncbi:MAG: lipopolysaccharide kinase InaA family protein [Gammaproteobacteria bacterium]
MSYFTHQRITPWRLRDVQQIEGTLVSQDSISWVKQCHLHGETFYVKYYKKAGKGLRRWFGRSRIRGEWENLQYFARLGIPIPPIIAYGEYRVWRYFHGGFLVTQAIPNTCNLQQFFEDGTYKAYDRSTLRRLIKIIAQYTKQLHNQRFIHKDLKWRNILISLTDEPSIYFIDCPLGGKQWQQKRGQRKDLAHLDKLARQFLAKKDRVYFYYCYKNVTHLSLSDKSTLRFINCYWS